MLLCGLDAKQAGEALDAAGGHISQTVKNCAIPE
jgi:hypothetical protein